MFWSKSSPPIGMASRRPTDIAVGFAGTKWNHYREENLSACGSIDIFSLPVADVLVAAARAGTRAHRLRSISEPFTDRWPRCRRSYRPFVRRQVDVCQHWRDLSSRMINRSSISTAATSSACFEAVPAVGGGTMVQATAKITAWYTDPMPARSGYRVLASNGRLENDFLDRIEEALIPTGKSPSATAQKLASIAPDAATPSGPSASPDALHSPGRPNPAAIGPSESSSLDSSLPGAAPVALRLAATPAMALPAGESLESARARRETDEKQAAELTAYVKNMEEIQRNQSRPTDLVAVKSPKAPIFAKPLADSQILFTAVTQDEFQLLGVEGTWAHVQISGPARGWIRRCAVRNACWLRAARGQRRCGSVGTCRDFQSQQRRNQLLQRRLGTTKRENGANRLGRTGHSDLPRRPRRRSWHSRNQSFSTDTRI